MLCLPHRKGETINLERESTASKLAESNWAKSAFLESGEEAREDEPQERTDPEEAGEVFTVIRQNASDSESESERSGCNQWKAEQRTVEAATKQKSKTAHRLRGRGKRRPETPHASRGASVSKQAQVALLSWERPDESGESMTKTRGG